MVSDASAPKVMILPVSGSAASRMVLTNTIIGAVSDRDNYDVGAGDGAHNGCDDDDDNGDDDADNNDDDDDNGDADDEDDDDYDGALIAGCFYILKIKTVCLRICVLTSLINTHTQNIVYVLSVKHNEFGGEGAYCL
jgi:hypothetical protein